MRIRTASAALAVVLLAAGCSGKTADNKDSAGDDGVKTGPGVTKDKITVGS